MRLLSRPNRRIGDTVYKTWYISLRVKTVDELGWAWGQELEVTVDGNALTIRPRNQSRNESAARQTGEVEKNAASTR